MAISSQSTSAKINALQKIEKGAPAPFFILFTTAPSLNLSYRRPPLVIPAQAGIQLTRRVNLRHLALLHKLALQRQLDHAIQRDDDCKERWEDKRKGRMTKTRCVFVTAIEFCTLILGLQFQKYNV